MLRKVSDGYTSSLRSGRQVTAFRNIQWTSILDGLGVDHARDIESRLSTRAFAPRTSIFEEGDPSNELLIIESGRVRLFKRTVEGDEFTTGIWSEGYVIGLISALLGDRRFLSAESIDPVRLLALKREDLLKKMQEIPLFATNVARLLALLASDSIERTVPLALDNTAKKLGRVLRKLATRDTQHSPAVHAVTGLRQEDLAHMVGASRAWVNQALADFERQGLIRREKGRIVIYSLDRFDDVLSQ